jgi:hypothetical protein
MSKLYTVALQADDSAVSCHMQVASLLREVLDIRLLAQHDSILDETSDPDQVCLGQQPDMWSISALLVKHNNRLSVLPPHLPGAVLHQ